MADTNHINNDSADLAAAMSLLALNSEVADSTDLTAAILMLDLNSITQPMPVNQETPETGLPIKQRSNSPAGNINALVQESTSPLVNVNRTQRYVPGSASRKLAPEACCFIRELSIIDADHDVGRLYLTRDEAETIPSCPQMTEVPTDTRKIAKLMVFDYQDVLWKMMLNCYKSQGNILYLLSIDDWRNFLCAHELGHGDTIFFYKNRDSRINADDYYYVVLFWRLKDGGFESFLNLPCKKTSRKRK